MSKPKRVGTISRNVISALDLKIEHEESILLGDSNIEHMKKKHPEAYEKYGKDIPFILGNPDYVGLNTKDESIEYVKEYKVDDEYVKVAVRVSGNRNYFARSIYVLNKTRVKNFITKGTLKKL